MPQPQCERPKANGERCENSTVEGSTLCSVHLGLAVGGAPSTLTDEVQARLADLLRAGNYVDVACAAAGVPRGTFYGWIKRGDPDGEAPEDEPYRRFRELIETARAEGEARLVTVIAKAARRSWQAAAWILERHAPERWERPSQRQRLELPAEAGGAASTDSTEQDPFDRLDELAPRREAKEARGG